MRNLATILLFIALIVALLVSIRAPIVSAEPRAQATATRTPTDEPAKPPYVFPTPIFIPTYPGDTPAPSARTTPIVPITGATTYTVVSGDSPWVIAQKVYGDGTKYQLILDANNMTKDSRLRVGSVLQIPSLTGTAPANAPTSAPTALVTTTVGTIPLAPSTAGTPTLVPAIFMTATPLRPLTPGATATPNASIAIPSQVFDFAPTVLNVLAGIFVIAAIVCSVFAFLLFNRKRRMEEMNTPKKRLTLRR